MKTNNAILVNELVNEARRQGRDLSRCGPGVSPGRGFSGILGENSLVKTGAYKPLQGYTRLYKAISFFFNIRIMRTQADGGESGRTLANARMCEAKAFFWQGLARISPPIGRHPASISKHQQALARISKRKQGYFKFFWPDWWLRTFCGWDSRAPGAGPHWSALARSCRLHPAGCQSLLTSAATGCSIRLVTLAAATPANYCLRWRGRRSSLTTTVV
jgi:hypothetical protein